MLWGLMSPERNLPTSDRGGDDFERQMELARKVMDEDQLVLRVLALGDQYPELDIESRLEMARQQKRRTANPARN
jgi:hypothetical protein